MFKIRLGILFLIIGISGCVSIPPIRDYNLAAAAMDAAKKQNAQELAPGLWAQAEATYRRAVASYEAESFKKAKVEFNSARELAEKAENVSVIKKAEVGGAD